MKVVTVTNTEIGEFHPALPLGLINPSKTNPRKHFDPVALSDLASSIKEKGIIEPIIVREIVQVGTKDARYEIVAGERRWRASKEADQETIPAICRNLSDVAVLEIQLIENLQREDVHELEEARGYQRLMKEAKYDVAMIAEKVGKSKEYVYARLKLLDLIDPIAKLFIEGSITAGHAVLIARLPEDSQKMILKDGLYQEEWMGEEGRVKTFASVRGLGAWIQQNIQMELKKAPFDVGDPGLVRAVGACTACPKQTGSMAGLFPELGKKPCCTDRKCFNGKVDAFVKIGVRSNEMIPVTSEYGKKSATVLYEHSLRKIQKASDRCESAKKAVVIDGRHKGEAFEICTNSSCKKHNSSSHRSTSIQKTPAEKLKAAQINIAAQATNEYAEKLCDAIDEKLKKLPKGKPVFSPAALLMILSIVYDALDYDIRSTVSKNLGLTTDGSGADSSELVKFADELDTPKVEALIAGIAARCNPSLYKPYENQDERLRNLEELADGYGVNTSAIMDEVDALKKERLSQAKTKIDASEKKQAPVATKGKKAKAQTSAKKNGGGRPAPNVEVLDDDDSPGLFGEDED